MRQYILLACLPDINQFASRVQLASPSETPSSELEIHFPSNSDQVSRKGQATTSTHAVCVRAGRAPAVSIASGARPNRLVSFCKLIIIYRAGILETIFDGIQRPLKTIADISGSVFVPRGVDLPSLDQDRLYTFVPNHDKRPGSIVAGGDKIG